MNFHTRKWVKPEDLNPNGTLFGGSLLRWIDEEAAIYAIVQLGNQRVVTKYKALRKLGAPKVLAKKGAGASKSYWRVAGGPVLSSTLTNEYLKRKGWTWLALIARPVEWHLTGC